MASLRQTINKGSTRLRRGPGGQLVESSGEGLQTLAGIAGLSTTPLTPLGGQLMGAGPDQAKMVGTPAQKQSALSIAVGEQDRLDVVERRRQAGAAPLTDSEKSTTARGQGLAGLEGIQERVQTLVDSYLPRASAQQPPVQLTTTTAAAPGVSSGDEPAFRQELDGYLRVLGGRPFESLSSHEQQLAMTSLAKASEVGNLGRAITSDEVPGLMQSSGQFAGGAAAAATGSASDVTVGNLIASGGLDYSLPELAELIGVQESSLAAYTLPQLTEAVQAIEAQEFSRVEQLQQMVRDPAVGASERQAARMELARASATGTRSIDAQLDNVISAVENADIVEFGGQSYTVADLLSDPTVEGIVGRYVSLDESDPAKKQLRETEPEFTAFLDNNLEVFQEAVKQAGLGVGKFQEIQNKNREKLQTLSGLSLSKPLQELVLPDFSPGDFQDREIDLADVSKPIFQVLQKPEAATLVAGLNELATSPSPDDKQLLLELLDKDEATLRRTGAFDGTQKWKNFLSWRRRKSELSSTTSPDQMLQSYFGEPVSLDNLQKQYDRERAMAVLGLVDETGLESFRGILDSDRDGRIDTDPAQLRRGLLAGLGEVTIDDLARGMDAPGPRRTPSFQTPSGAEQVMRLFGGAAADGKLTSMEIEDAISRGQYTDADITNTSLPPGMSDTEKKLDNHLSYARQSRINELLPESLRARNPSEALAQLSVISKPDNVQALIAGDRDKLSQERNKYSTALSSIVKFQSSVPRKTDLWYAIEEQRKGIQKVLNAFQSYAGFGKLAADEARVSQEARNKMAEKDGSFFTGDPIPPEERVAGPDLTQAVRDSLVASPAQVGTTIASTLERGGVALEKGTNNTVKGLKKALGYPR